VDRGVARSRWWWFRFVGWYSLATSSLDCGGVARKRGLGFRVGSGVWRPEGGRGLGGGDEIVGGDVRGQMFCLHSKALFGSHK
jgi:hypothetical protein